MAQDVIKSISYDQEEIINNIIKLHCPQGIECDPTYSKGMFYKNITPPLYRFDTVPQTPETLQADCRDLPLDNNSIRSIMFDPPFIVAASKTSKIGNRFGSYPSIGDLWNMYTAALREFNRVLEPSGILIFKCQDTISSSKQYFSEFFIIKTALALGFYPKDKFILLAKNRLIGRNCSKQQHCRKFHSYFLVFEKRASRVNYDNRLRETSIIETSKDSDGFGYHG